MSPSICNTQERVVSGVLSLYFRDVNVDRCQPFYSQRKETPRYETYRVYNQTPILNLSKDEPKKHTTTQQRLRGLVKGEYSTRFHEEAERLCRSHLITPREYELAVLTRPKPSGDGTNLTGSTEADNALMKLLCLMLSTNEGIDSFFKQLKKEEDTQKRIEIIEDLFYFISKNTSSQEETRSHGVDRINISYLYKMLASQSYIDKDTKNSILLAFLDNILDRFSQKQKDFYRSDNLSWFLEDLLFNPDIGEIIYLDNYYNPVHSKILLKVIKILVQSYPPVKPYLISSSLYYLKRCYPDVIHDNDYKEASTIAANYTARRLLDKDGSFIIFGDPK